MPAIGLVETKLSSGFSFFYTPEKSEKVALLKRYFSNRYPDNKIEFHELPSIGEPSAQVTAISSALGNFHSNDQQSAVFVTAGTKLMSMTMLLHSKSKSMISLRRPGLQYLVDGDVSNSIAVADKFNLNQVLFSCGWVFDGNKLVKDNRKTTQINVTYDNQSGQLSFLGIVEEGRREGEEMVAFMSALSKEFGRTGADYEISGKLRRRALNILPTHVRYEPKSKEEEE